MKYRILKKSKTYEDNRVKNTYRIQVKFLWMWFNANTKCCYVLYGMGGSPSGQILERTPFIFDNEEMCQKHLEDNFINKVDITYKGNWIQKRYYSAGNKEMYVNLSKRMERYSTSTTYEACHKLEELKSRIDRRTLKGVTSKVV